MAKPKQAELEEFYESLEDDLTENEILIAFIDEFGLEFTEEEIAVRDTLAAYMSAIMVYYETGEWANEFIEDYPEFIS